MHLRLFNVVGPGQDSAGGMVLPTFVEQARRGQAITVHGDGRQVRTLAHVDDVAADLVDMVLRPSFPAGPLNLGGTARCTVLQLARAVAREGAQDGGAGESPIRFVDPRRSVSPGFEGVAHREPCLARARSLGLARRTRSLGAIVRDTLERHPEPSVRIASGPARPEHPPCGSPAS